MSHLSDMDIEKFQKIEANPYEREIFVKLRKCKINVFYQIEKFKQDKKKFMLALKKRKYLFNDIEFNQEETSFRVILPTEETYEQAMCKERELAKNVCLSCMWGDETLEIIKKDPEYIAASQKNKSSYTRKK